MPNYETMLYQNDRAGKTAIAQIQEFNRQGWRLVAISHSSTCYWLERERPDGRPVNAPEVSSSRSHGDETG